MLGTATTGHESYTPADLAGLAPDGDESTVHRVTIEHVAAGCTVLRFVANRGATPDKATRAAETPAADLKWPTIEAVAVLWRMSQFVLAGVPQAAGARRGPVAARETHLTIAIDEPGEAS